MAFHPATDPQQVTRGMELLERYKRRRLRTIAECLELQRWLQAAYLENPYVEPEQQEKARMVYAGVAAVRVDMEYKDALRP